MRQSKYMTDYYCDLCGTSIQTISNETPKVAPYHRGWSSIHANGKQSYEPLVLCGTCTSHAKAILRFLGGGATIVEEVDDKIIPTMGG